MANGSKSFSDIAKVMSVSPNLIQVEVFDTAAYQLLTPKVSIGSYLTISDDNNLSIIAIVQSFKIKDILIPASDTEEDETKPAFILEAQQVGCFDKEGKFKRGGQQIAVPPTCVELTEDSDLEKIYQGIEKDKQFSFGSLSQNKNIRVTVDGDKFFGKHIGIVGSTGSGKSCTIAKILQEGIKPSDDQKTRGVLNNSHILIFDLHGEYNSAFPNANKISIANLHLPYWLMNSEELEEIFIESQEQNSHNQISQFKYAVIKNKEKHNPGLKVDYDTPVYFSLEEVYRYIDNQNRATKDATTRKLAVENPPAGVIEEYLLFEKIEFKAKEKGKYNAGPYEGEFDRFVSRFDTKFNDERLSFLLKPRKNDGQDYKTSELLDLIKQFLGYIKDKRNITIIDLSGIPFEVLSIVVSLITRLIFTFAFHLKKVGVEQEDKIPFLLVYEEAHNYIPQSEGAKYKSVKKSIERIAKEGRKYGISLMIASQRPSEISETIFSQCNNFVAMRLTNPTDQQYIKRLLPDSINAITDSLPILERQEAIILGDSISVPSVIQVDDITDKPNSNDIYFQTEWKKDWYDAEFGTIMKQLVKEKPQNTDSKTAQTQAESQKVTDPLQGKV